MQEDCPVPSSNPSEPKHTSNTEFEAVTQRVVIKGQEGEPPVSKLVLSWVPEESVPEEEWVL